MASDPEIYKYATKPTGTFWLFWNKVKANFGSQQSVFGFVKSAFFYIAKKGPQKVKKSIILLARRLYLSVENEHIIILNGADSSLIYSKRPYQYWLSKNTIQPKDYERVKADSDLWNSRPFFDILVCVKTFDKHAERTLLSLTAQLFSNWKLSVLTENAVTKQELKDFMEKFFHQKEQYQILLPADFSAHEGNNHFVLTLKQGDTLTPDALYWFAKNSLINPEADILYADEDLMGQDCTLHSPNFKPDWCPDNLLTTNYIGQAVVFKRELLETLGGWVQKIFNDEVYDIILQASEHAKGVYHIAKILYHSSERIFSETERHNNKKALSEAMLRRGESGWVDHSETMRQLFIPRFTLKGEPKISIIIPTKDKTAILKTCIESVIQLSTYQNFEIVLVDNNSTSGDFFKQTAKWKEDYPSIFNCYRTEEPFNFALLMNFGASHSSGDFFILLNNDVEVITPNWMELMLEQAQRASIGVVGAKLLYPNNTVQHAGVVIGLSEAADHVFVGTPRYGNTYQQYLHRVTNYSALTAACLMVSKQKFDEVNGFNESFQVEYNDIDFCLRLKNKGYHHVYLPHVELYHHESISRGHPFATAASYERHLREFALMQKTWKQYILHDPCYNPNLSLKDRNMQVAY
jgi:O-antigen biosynthesis protein